MYRCVYLLIKKDKMKSLHELYTAPPEVEESPKKLPRVQKLIALIDRGVIQKSINDLVNPKEKIGALLSFASLLGIPEQQLPTLITQLKTVVKNPNI